MHGATVLEFGTPWCGYCISIRPLVAARMAEHPQVRHLRIEDGPGRPLGRSFGIKLPSGADAHTACIGFGVERIALALFKTHGLSTARWPAGARKVRPRKRDSATLV